MVYKTMGHIVKQLEIGVWRGMQNLAQYLSVVKEDMYKVHINLLFLKV